MLPAAVKAELAAHLERVRAQHQADLRRGAGWVELPGALACQIPERRPRMAMAIGVPGLALYGSGAGRQHRHHLHESVLQRAGEGAVGTAVTKPATPHTLRHSFATHLLDPATTSEPFRSCSDTMTSRPRSIPMSSTEAGRGAKPGRPRASVMGRGRHEYQAVGDRAISCGISRYITGRGLRKRPATWREVWCSPGELGVPRRYIRNYAIR